MRLLHQGALPICLWLAGAGIAQDPAAAPALDAALPDQLKDLKTMLLDRKMDEDFRAINLIQQLAKDAAKRHPKDADRIVKALAAVFRTGKLRPPDQAHVYREAADALAQYGPEGAKELQKAIADERLSGRDYVSVRVSMLTALGRSKDDKQVEFLLQQALRSPDDDVMAAAGEALGNFTALPIKQRREVVKDLVGRYGEWHMKATQPDPTNPNAPIDFGPQNARQTLNKIEGKWNATLRALTGQSFGNAPDWQRWLNKNKDWEAPRSPGG
jgi:hypothetical protein